MCPLRRLAPWSGCTPSLGRCRPVVLFQQWRPKRRVARREWLPNLTGRSFHTRLHRRGSKLNVRTPDAERLFNRLLLEPRSPLGFPESKPLDDYLTLRRQLGFKLAKAERYLRQFLCYADQEGTGVLTTKLALQWATLEKDNSSKAVSVIGRQPFNAQNSARRHAPCSIAL